MINCRGLLRKARIGLGTTTACLLSLAFLGASPAVVAQAGPAPIVTGCDVALAGHYFVVLKEGSFRLPGEPASIGPAIPALAVEISSGVGADLGHVYKFAIQGFSVEATASEVQAISSDARVSYLEEVCVGNTTGPTSVQEPAPWNLHRVSTGPLPAAFYRYQYNSAGDQAKVYVMDTGIRAWGAEFDDVAPGRSFIVGESPSDVDDCVGHGTAVSSIVGGNYHGVAKDVTIVPLRVVNHIHCNGTVFSHNVVKAIDWLMVNHQGPSIVNMSFEFRNDPSFFVLRDALEALVDTDVIVVAAAGNRNKAACLYLPAAISKAITVGATVASDHRWVYPGFGCEVPGVGSVVNCASNWGSCVDLWAPGGGVDILALDGTYSSGSGTSFAAPHVAGALVLRQSTAGVSGVPYTSSDLQDWLFDDAAPAVLHGNLGLGSPNAFLDAKPESAAIDWSCTAATSTCTGSFARSRWYQGGNASDPFHSLEASVVTGALGQNFSLNLDSNLSFDIPVSGWVLVKGCIKTDPQGGCIDEVFACLAPTTPAPGTTELGCFPSGSSLN